MRIFSLLWTLYANGGIGGSPEIYIQLPMCTFLNSMWGLRSLEGHLPRQIRGHEGSSSKTRKTWGNLLTKPRSGSSEPKEAEENWENWNQTSNFGLESSIFRMMLCRVTLDISTPGYLLAARLYLCCKHCSRPHERSLNIRMAWYNDSLINGLISFLSLTTAHLDLANPLARKTYQSTIRVG